MWRPSVSTAWASAPLLCSFRVPKKPTRLSERASLWKIWLPTSHLTGCLWAARVAVPAVRAPFTRSVTSTLTHRQCGGVCATVWSRAELLLPLTLIQRWHIRTIRPRTCWAQSVSGWGRGWAGESSCITSSTSLCYCFHLISTSCYGGGKKSFLDLKILLSLLLSNYHLMFARYSFFCVF